MSNSVPWIIMNGEFHLAEEDLLPVNSRAVRYGDGCFETFRTYKGRILKLDEHLNRLRNGLQYLEIKPPIEIRKSRIRTSVKQLLERNNLGQEDAVVRIQIWREGDRGFNVADDTRSGYCMTVSKLPEIPGSVHLATVSTRRIPAESVNPSYKLSNSINYIKAASEAADKKADDALMLTIDDYVAETTIANIFWINEGNVFTPSVKCDILPGITRQMIIDILTKEFEVKVIEDQFKLNSLRSAEAAWICNSVREIVPVAKLDDVEYNVQHPFLNKIFEAFRDKITAELD